MKRVLIIISIILAVFLSYKVYQYFTDDDSFIDGYYVNEGLGFSMDFPEDWRPVKKPDWLMTPAWSGIKEALFISPSVPEEAVIAVSTLDSEKIPQPIAWDKMWNMVVNGYKSNGLKTEINRIDTIDDIEVHRLGGTMNYYMGGAKDEYYIEIVLFATGSGIVQMDIIIKEPVEREMFGQIDSVVSSIRFLS
jgi:hypothetical protein